MAAATGRDRQRSSEAPDGTVVATVAATSGARRVSAAGAGASPRPTGRPGAMRELLFAVEASLTARTTRGEGRSSGGSGGFDGGAQTHRRLQPRVRVRGSVFEVACLLPRLFGQAGMAGLPCSATPTRGAGVRHAGRAPKTSVGRLPADLQAHVAELLRRSNTRWWASTRGKELAPPRLHPAILRTIREWFDLVDDDKSGTLEHHELMGALQARAALLCSAIVTTRTVASGMRLVPRACFRV